MLRDLRWNEKVWNEKRLGNVIYKGKFDLIKYHKPEGFANLIEYEKYGKNKNVDAKGKWAVKKWSNLNEGSEKNEEKYWMKYGMDKENKLNRTMLVKKAN